MSALDPDKIEEIREQLSEAISDIEYSHPDEAIQTLLAVLGSDLTGADGAIIERAIDRLGLIAVELLKVSAMLNNAPFSFGKLWDEDAS